MVAEPETLQDASSFLLIQRTAARTLVGTPLARGRDVPTLRIAECVVNDGARFQGELRSRMLLAASDSGYISHDAGVPANLIAANAVLAVHQHPKHRHPLVQTNGQVRRRKVGCEVEVDETKPNCRGPSPQNGSWS